MSTCVKRFLIPAVVLLPLACSGNGDDAGSSGAHAGDDAIIVPEGLTVAALAGGNGVLEVTGFTLLNGPNGAEVYAALKNVGDIPACHAAFSIELFDKTEQSLAAGIGGLLTSHFYRLTDGSDIIAACVGPGDVTMAAVTDLPSDIVIEDVGYVVYRCPYFALDVVPIEGLGISQVQRVNGNTGALYTGTLVNGFDVAVSDPSVTVFPVNRVGRPLGRVIGSGTGEIQPGGSWIFETNTVDTPGVDHAAYPAAALVRE
jgi:hypothetical protein